MEWQVMDWFRWHHGTVTDPKWRVTARRAGVTLRDVLAVWAAMLECASQAPERGLLDGWDHEDIGAALDMEPEQIAAIYAAMQGKVLDGDRVAAWGKRQPVKEDRTATERKRAQRDRERKESDQAGREGASRDVTNGHAPDKIRLDKKREEKSTDEKSSAGEPARVVQAVETSEAEVFRVGKDVLGRNAGGMIANLRKAQHFDDRAALDLIEQARAKNDPREWLGAVLRGDATAATPEHILFPPEIYRNVL
jgi:hypothetical protein